MKSEPTSAEHIREMLRQAEEISRDAERIAGGLTDAQLAWVPPAGGWSIGQVLEHLVLGGIVYNEHLGPFVDGVKRSGAGGADAPWRPSLVGRLLVGSLRPTQRRKLKAPKRIAPGPEPRPHVLAAFLACQTELSELMRRSHDVDLRRAKTRSPLNRLVTLNLGDCFAVVVVHAQRHVEQMARIRAADGFPAAERGAVHAG
jgi:hypothetical protein